MAGNRILDYVPTFADAGRKLDVWEDPGMKIAWNYITTIANMRSEVYFFVVSFANYLKSLDRLGIKKDLERFKETRELVKALRNVYEHWEKHDSRDWHQGKLNPQSQKNYQAFANKFPNSPSIAFWFIETQDLDLTIASIIKVRNTLELMDRNESVLNEYLTSISTKVNLLL